MPGTMSMLSCRVIFCDTSHFVIRSQRTMSAAIMMWYLRIVSIRRLISRGDSDPALLFSLLIRFQSQPERRNISHKPWGNAHFPPRGSSNSSTAHTSVPELFLLIRAKAYYRSRPSWLLLQPLRQSAGIADHCDNVATEAEAHPEPR